MLHAALALVLLQAPAAPDTTRPAPLDPRVVAGAYADPQARELVRRAREYRHFADRSLRGYQALARQRTSAGLRTGLAERLLEGSELAARVDWHRDGPAHVQVVGARARGVADDDDDGDADVTDQARELAFDPADDRLRMGLLGTDWIRHPLAAGSERDYRFSAGDTLTVRLSGGEFVRVYELRLQPRHLDAPLVSGSIWLEDRSFGVVRTLLRLSHALNEELFADSKRDSAGRREVHVGADLSGSSEPRQRSRRRGAWNLLPEVRIDVRYITTEYGLVQGRWWMPTLTAVDATMTAGNWAAVPVRFERSYAEYQVEGDPLPPPGSATPTEVAVSGVDEAEAVADTPAACRGNDHCTCHHGRCREVQVTLPTDTTQLAHSAELPPPLSPNAPLLSGKEANDLGRELSRVASDPWIFTRPELRRTPLLLRYNRVEALSLGMRQHVDFGPLQADATLRIASATGQPDVEVGVRRETVQRRLRLAGYRRLAAANPLERPLGIGNSLAALLWGRDNGDYFRATGAELLGGPPRAVRPWIDWRLYAEHQGPVARATDVSLRGAFSSFEFRPNPAAERADQAGLALTLRPFPDSHALGGSWGAALDVAGETGTFRFARPALTLRGAIPAGRFAAAVEGSAGTSFGDVPVQSLWRLGGPGTLRGYDGGTAVGTAFWRARGELGTGSIAGRINAFTDLGWAGDRDDFSGQRALWSAGVGASVLQGLFRVDLARALRAPTGWRLELYMDGVL